MEDWKNIKIEGISSINKVVGVFEVWAIGVLPFGKFKVKIVEDMNGNLSGAPNIAAKNKRTGYPEWTSGFGDTVSDTLVDTINYLLESIKEENAVDENDFEWADSEVF